MSLKFGPRRARYIDIVDHMKHDALPLDKDDVGHLESFDLTYRSLCTALYNYVPTSGHPGGSISSGRFVTATIFDSMDFDMGQPDRLDADILSYAAGHKALGLYAMWALRDEVAMMAAPKLLPDNVRQRLRIEDLLGFRRNPTTNLRLFKKHGAKALDGHPTPATPFVRLATGASGVGLGASIGLAIAAADYYGEDAPIVHIVEGEGGMTPGRVGEAMAAAGTASLGNVVMHIDWNQSSIDSDRVCRDGDTPGDYVQWDPAEFAYLHDWNVIAVPDGTDFQQIVAAQRLARQMDNHQPTAIVYRTTKGWQYGIEGKASHGAGHKLCVDGFYTAMKPLLDKTGGDLPRCEGGDQHCDCGRKADVVEQCFWESLMTVRTSLDHDWTTVEYLSGRLTEARDRLEARERRPRENAPNCDAIFGTAVVNGHVVPDELKLEPGKTTTLRGELGRVLNFYNKKSDGAIVAAAADLLGSTSVVTVNAGFGEGYFHTAQNPGSRLLSIGGICEDAMAGVLSGISSFGQHVGVGSSYGAFNAPLGHIAARLHAIGNQARRAVAPGAYRPFILVCAHAGIKTGEDGPTHADPQALQLLQENFPPGTMATLTPWDPRELWPLMSAAFATRPAVIAPFVTRPNEFVLDRESLGLAPAVDARQGVYLLKAANGKADGTVVLQGSGVTYTFLTEALPMLDDAGIDLNVYYIASVELFDAQPREERETIFPPEAADEAMGITGFTLPTMYRWIRSTRGREFTMHPFQKGHYLGSGTPDKVIAEAGLDGESQFTAITRFVKEKKTVRPSA